MASVAKRYSDALFLAADGEGAADAVDADMGLLGIALGERELRHVLADPKRSNAEKKGLLIRLLTAEYGGEGEEGPQKREANPCTLRFLDVLFAKGRASELSTITSYYHTRVLESRGEVEGLVRTYEELGEKELKELEDAIGGKLGAKLKLRQEVDPKLLGGVRVFVKDSLFDASLQGQLEALGRKLRGAPLPELRKSGDTA